MVGFRKVIICSNDKAVAGILKDKVDEFCAHFCPKKEVDIIHVTYGTKINGYGISYAEHVDPRKIKWYFTKAKTMAADEADGLGSSVFIFAPKVIGKLGANHAMIGIGMYTNKDSRMIISQHIKLFSDEKKLGKAD